MAGSEPDDSIMSYARSGQCSMALSSSLHAYPRPMEPDLSNGGISLVASTSSGMTGFSDLHSKGALVQSSSANDALMRLQSQQQDPLSHWYTSQQGPWNPVHGRNPNLLPGRISWAGAPSFSTHRSYTSPSECGTTPPGHIPSDSGYGSLPRQSVVESSLYGDRDQSGDAASVSSRLAGIQIDRPMVFATDTWGQQVQSINEVSAVVKTNNLMCPICEQKVKTKSELKKHHQRHTKPYHCPVANCLRPGGFSTPNDVDRHVKSCHKDVGQGKYYKCLVKDCRTKEKKWPRADNFRQHLKRVHHIYRPDEDLEKYVYRPQLSPGPDIAALASVGQGLAPLYISHSVVGSSAWPFNVQPAPQTTPRDSCGLNDYMNQQLAFQTDLLPQQHLEMMSNVGDHVRDNLMQMSPTAPEDSAPLPRSKKPHAAPQGLHDLAVSSNGGQETNFEETNFFHEASISNDESVEGGEPAIRHVLEVERSFSEEVCGRSRHIVRSANPGYEETSDAGGDQDEPLSHNVITPNDGDSSSSPSASTDASSSGDHDLMQIARGVVDPSASQVSRAPFDFSDVLQDQTKAFDLIKALKEQGMLEELLEQVKYQSPREEEAIPRIAAPSDREESKNKHACQEPGCDKFFPRQCELRKHTKRHVKPYGCTYEQCDKRFGSKNDWKRHENSQHYQLELWKCDEKSQLDLSERCNKAFNRREQFIMHLSRDHGITDSAVVERKVEDCLDGRDCELKFWCGFCKKMVQVKDKGKKAWLGRINHIDGHFSGQMDISEWKSPDPGLQEVDIVMMAASDSSHSGSQNAANISLAAEALSSLGRGPGGRPPKRGAEEGGQQPRPSKRARSSALWYCCGCGSQQIAGFSFACLTPRCGGHEQCGHCEFEAIPLTGEDDF